MLSSGQPAEEVRDAWLGRRLLTLPNRLAVSVSDLVGLPDSTAIGISVVPDGFENELYYPLHGQCPICAQETEPDSRRAICLHVRFRGLDCICVPAWAHRGCIEACTETEVDAGIPW
jgi:hypothetical protein